MILRLDQQDEAQMDRLRTTAEKLRARIDSGTSWESEIESLHEQGYSIIESIWIVRQASRKSLGEAKLLVTSQPVWAKVVEKNEPLHDEFEKAFGRDEKH